MEYRTLSFIEKTIVFKGCRFRICAIDEKTILQKEIELIEKLNNEFATTILVYAPEMIKFALNNKIDYNQDLGNFLCTIG